MINNKHNPHLIQYSNSKSCTMEGEILHNYRGVCSVFCKSYFTRLVSARSCLYVLYQ